MQKEVSFSFCDHLYASGDRGSWCAAPCSLTGQQLAWLLLLVSGSFCKFIVLSPRES